MALNQEELHESKVALSKRHYITISSLIAVFVWAISATVFLIRYMEVTPLKGQLKSQEAVHAQNVILKKEVENLQHTLNTVLKDVERPTLTNPPLEASLVGGHVTFAWEYSKHNPHQKYILEIRNISESWSIIERYNVLNPESKLMHFPLKKHGEYLWRIRPGQLLNGNIISQGSPSYYNFFVVYPSVVKRIEKTNVIRVGTSPTFTGYFNLVDHTGVLKGFDIDLIHWIAKRLSKDREKPLKVEFYDIPWSDLLPKLQKHEVDLIISSMTATIRREKENPGVKFTKGYYQSHQIFIGMSEGGACREDLKHLRVGVNQNTTNEGAAKAVQDKFDFYLDAAHTTYADLYRSLEENRIDYALVDDILVKKYLGNRFWQCGEHLGDELISFYEKNFPQKKEMYAIAVMEEKGKNLRLLINDILDSEEGEDKKECLKKKWILSDDPEEIKCD